MRPVNDDLSLKLPLWAETTSMVEASTVASSVDPVPRRVSLPARSAGNVSWHDQFTESLHRTTLADILTLVRWSLRSPSSPAPTDGVGERRWNFTAERARWLRLTSVSTNLLRQRLAPFKSDRSRIPLVD